VSRPSIRNSAPKHRASSVDRRAAAPASRPFVAGKHAAERPHLELGRRIGRNAVLPGITAAALGAAALAGVVSHDPEEAATAALLAEVNSDPSPSSVDSDVLRDLRTERQATTSRSDRRTEVDRTKLQALSQEAESGGQVTKTEDLGGGDPRQIAQAMLPEFGFSSDQFSCLDSLWTKESGWNTYADNPSSSAYGIPQALPGEKMATAGADWANNPATQIRWGLGYIADSYGSPCSAWAHSQSYNWY
jgi:hypothetical protein